jgi:hypothetical protein
MGIFMMENGRMIRKMENQILSESLSVLTQTETNLINSIQLLGKKIL